MIYADLPPKLWTPPKPAIIRPGEPWQDEAQRKLAELGLPSNVCQAVIKEMDRLRGQPKSTIRPQAEDICRWAKLEQPKEASPLFLMLLALGQQPIRATYLQSYGQSSGSFTNCNIGTAAANRYVIVYAGCGYGNSTQGTPTINGVNATVVVTGSGGQGRCSIFIALVTSGTTGVTINTAYSGSNSMGIDIWVTYNLSATTPFATGSSGAQPGSITLTPAGNGFLISGRSTGGGASAPSMTWTNATKVSDISPDGSNSHSAAHVPSTTNASLNVQASNAADGNRAMCAACWGQ